MKNLVPQPFETPTLNSKNENSLQAAISTELAHLSLNLFQYSVIIVSCCDFKQKPSNTLKLNEGEGFTITHENQNYKITAVEREKIGDLELYRYKTKQGEEFLHIPTENKKNSRAL